MNKAEKRELVRELKRRGIELKFGPQPEPVCYSGDEQNYLVRKGWVYKIPHLSRFDWQECEILYRYDWMAASRAGVSKPARELLKELGVVVLTEEPDERHDCTVFEVQESIVDCPPYLQRIL